MLLGKLEKVDLRSVWESEAQKFTPWLAKEENLAEIGRIIGMELELVAQEQPVEQYRADILCKDTLSQNFVLIENQLEKTDHSHLGQIMTYAAGVRATAIVWIASQFTEAHRAAIDWMNEITAEEYGFFGLEIELWRIGNSPPAPKFNVVSRPNDWLKYVAEASALGKLSDTKLFYQRYWTAFREFISERPGTVLRSQKPLPQHWTNFAVGRSGFTMAATASSEKKKRLGAEIYIQPKDIEPKAAFAALLADKPAIEASLGFQLDWQELPEAKGSRIAIFQQDVDVTNEALWPEQFAWLAEKLEKLHDVFGPKIRKL